MKTGLGDMTVEDLVKQAGAMTVTLPLGVFQELTKRAKEAEGLDRETLAKEIEKNYRQAILEDFAKLKLAPKTRSIVRAAISFAMGKNAEDEWSKLHEENYPQNEEGRVPIAVEET